MKKLGIFMTTLLLLAVLVLMLFSSGLLPISSNEEEKHAFWYPQDLFTSTEQKQENYTFKAPATLAVVNPLGSISVQGTDGQKIEVGLVKKAEAITSARAYELLQEITLETKEDGTVLELILHAPPTGTNNKIQADLSIQVPRGTAIDLYAGCGEVSAASCEGSLRIINDLGSIELTEHTGNAALETRLGNIRITDSIFTDELVAITDVGDIFIGGRLAQKNSVESRLGNVTFLLSPTDAYVLEGTLGLGGFSTMVGFKGEHSEEGNFKGIAGKGQHRGLIFFDLTLGSLKLTNGREEDGALFH